MCRLFALMLVPVAIWAQASLSIVGATTAPNKAVTVPITIQSGSKAAASQWALSVPSGVTLNSVTIASGASGAAKTLGCNTNNFCLLSGSNGNLIPDGTLATVSLTPTTTGSFPISLSNVIIIDAASWPISVLGTTGTGGVLTSVLPAPPPIPAIASAPSNPTTQTFATISFSDSQFGVAFQCNLDSTAYAACTSPVTYTGLAIGTHSFFVYAMDAYNQQSPVATYSWTINLPPPTDTVPPNITITYPTNGATVPRSIVTLTCNASDNVAVANVQWKLDGVNLPNALVTAAPYSLVWNAGTVKGKGNHTMTAVATDTSGNTKSASVSFRVQ